MQLKDVELIKMAAKKSAKSSKPSPELLEQCKKDVHRALSKAVKVLFDDEHNGGDWYAHILMQMDRIFDVPRIKTAAVSITNKINLYINSYFFVHELGLELKDKDGKIIQPALDLSKQEDRRLLNLRRAMVIKHEILHCVFHHLSRWKDFGDPILANMAADLVVNSCMVDQNILGRQFLYPEKVGLPKDKAFDWYYKNYPLEEYPLCQTPTRHDMQYQKQSKSDDNQEQPGNQGQPTPGEAQEESKDEGQEGEQDDDSDQGHSHSVDGQGKCKVCGGQRPFDNHDVWQEGDDEHMSDSMRESLINEAINRATNATKNAGRLPSSIQEMIALARKKPQIPWQTILKQFVSRLSNGVLYHTKKRPSKRFNTYPGTKIMPKLKLGVGIDVSGSISNPEYEIFMNEIFAIAKAVGGEVEVVEWDTQVQGIYKLKGYKPNVTRTGCGGTDPAECIKYFNQRRHKFDGILMFTDGYLCSNVDKGLRIPGMWVITADGSTDCISKARIIRLPKEEGAA